MGYSYDSITEDTNVYVKFRANFWVDVVLEDGNSSSNYGFVESTDGNSMWDAGTAASADMDAEMEIRAVPRPGFNFVEWRAATNLNRVDFENAETYSTDQTITIHFTGNMTVYAVFEQDETARFTVTLDPNNGIEKKQWDVLYSAKRHNAFYYTVERSFHLIVERQLLSDGIERDKNRYATYCGYDIACCGEHSEYLVKARSCS